MPRVCVDWDDTLVPGVWPDWSDRWLPGAVESLYDLALIAEVSIFSARINNSYENVVKMRHILDSQGLQHVNINNSHGKPGASLFIDDRALHFAGDWESTLVEAKRRLGIPGA